MKWLWGNWELKLVSLVVAVALWTYTSGQVRVERQFLVEVAASQIEGVPDGLQVSAVEPAEFVVILSVPTSKLADLRSDVLKPAIRLPRERRSEGDVELPLTSRLLGLDADVRLMRTEPGDVRRVLVHLQAIATVTLPAAAPPVIGLPSGVAAELRLGRTQVEVRGPRDAIALAEASGQPLRFEPVRLEGVDPAMAQPREEIVALRPIAGQPQPVEPVLATVSLRPARSASATVRVPLSVLLAPAEAGRWRVAGATPIVELRCTGPESVIRTLRPEDLTAWTDLHATTIVAGPREMAVAVEAPAGVTVDPARFVLDLQPAQ
jgi:hypothetical protein